VLAVGAASSCASDPGSRAGKSSTGSQGGSSCREDACCSPTSFATTAVTSGASRVLELRGFARDAGARIRIEAYGGCGKGTVLTKVRAGTTAKVTVPDALYPWSATVTVPTSDWPQGGTVQIRSVSDDGSGAGFVLGRAAPFEAPSCVTANGHAGWEGVLEKCTRYASFADQLANPLVTFVDTDPDPVATTPGSQQFLQASITSPSDTEKYYANIDASPGGNGAPPGSRFSFSGWKCANGFADCADAAGDRKEVSAVYFNHGDLGTGREMHCREVKACDGSPGTPGRCDAGAPVCSVVVRIACYVTNYLHQDPTGPVSFPAPFPGAVDDAVDRQLPAATVAMESLVAGVDCATGATSAVPPDTPDKVRFYIYDTLAGGTGNVLPSVPLDSEGPKQAPGVCLSCHGGKLDTATARVTGSSFLPFDVCGFEFSSRSGFGRADQHEDFKHLNAIVYRSGPAPAIREVVDGWYRPKGVFDATSRFDGAFVPADWIASGQQDLYLNVVKPHCRTCHAAQGTTAPDLERYSDFQELALYIQDGLCNGKPGFTMAERTHQNFWSGPARAYLTEWLGSTMGLSPQCQGQPLACQ
jgi:hypothetical protein